MYSEPSSYEEALKDVNWANAMNDEMHALYENKTWFMIDLLIGISQLVVNGCLELSRNLMVKWRDINLVSTVRCLINLAVQKNWKIYQMDVNNAFLYGDLKEEVYMLPHPRFFKNGETKVCKHEKSLYGLKQAPRQWNHKLSKALLEQSKNDHSLFIKNKRYVCLYLLVYGDDLVITGSDVNEIESFKSFLSNKFKIKDLGELKYFLMIEVLKTKTGLCLSQRKYYLDYFKSLVY
ncbi:ribonuclease H-like domain-containing protein [Tanacetum coccineum]